MLLTLAFCGRKQNFQALCTALGRSSLTFYKVLISFTNKMIKKKGKQIYVFLTAFALEEIFSFSFEIFNNCCVN